MVQSGYDKVATVIGEEMDKAWKNIMEKLSQNNISDFSGVNVSEIEKFFTELGGAELSICFNNNTSARGIRKTFSAHKITPVTLLGGYVTVGAGYSW